MDEKKVSIIIPVYNIEKYLSKCIESLIEQKYKNYEILLIDDGSTDRSGKIIDHYASIYSCVRAYHHTNRGVSYTRNRGIREAKGEYIAFIDGDDWADSNYLSMMVAYIEDNDLDFAVCNYSFYDDCSGKTEEWSMYKKSCCTDKNCAAEKLLTTSCVPWNKIYKAKIIRECAFPEDIAIGEDTIFLMKLLKKCQKIGFLNKSLLFYRQHSGSAMHSGIRPQIWDNISSGNIVYDIALSYSSTLRDAAEYRFVENISNILWKIKYSTDIRDIQKTYYKELKEMKIAIRKRYRLGSRNHYILKKKRQYLNIAYFSPFFLLGLFRFVNFIQRR